MVDAVVGFAVKKLDEYLAQEVSLLSGVKDEVERLKTDLECLHGLLKDAMEDENDKSKAFKEWINQARDLAYEAEDILDTHLLNVEERDKSKRERFLDFFKKCSKGANAYKIANDIRSLNKKINALSSRFETYCNKNVGKKKATSSKLQRLRRTPSVIEDEHVVGVEDDAKLLLEKLLHGDSKTYMISIFGPGGLGKTALARKLYNLTEVDEKFDCRGWICVSKEYETRDLLKSIIKSFKKSSEAEFDRINMMTEEDLERYLRNFLKGKRYLVVVDDIWEKEAWESLKRSFPKNGEGSIVIMTTRIQGVAEGADERVYAHNLRFLSPAESWELFKRKAFRDLETVSRDQEELGNEMVQKCRGLPLAIIILAGILKKKKDDEWQVVRDHIWRSLRDNSIHILGLLDLSFSDLCYELKICFLYLGIFPEDFEIEVENLIQLLVAEGFIQEDEDTMSLEEVAEQYIHELMDKSLVQVGYRSLNGKITTCCVHDLLRDLAIRKAKDLNFINVNGGRTLPSTCRREVIHCVRGKDFPTSNLHKQMRSLFVRFKSDGYKRYCTKHDHDEIICGNFKLLRVLDFGGIFGEHAFLSEEEKQRCSPKAIGKLIHLRYLQLLDYDIDDLPASFSNLCYLQTLVASSCVFKKTVDLRKLTSLRHIYGKFHGDLLIDDATKLQTLKTVTGGCWSKISQHNPINLRSLTIENPHSPYPLGIGSFSNAKNLRHLVVVAKNFNFAPKEYPPYLRTVKLHISKLEEDPMPVLENLPRLQHLSLRVDEYPRKKLICSAKGFPRLKYLGLIKIDGLEEVHIAENAMPDLVDLHLVIGRCGRFLTRSMIPERFAILDMI